MGFHPSFTLSVAPLGLQVCSDLKVRHDAHEYVPIKCENGRIHHQCTVDPGRNYSPCQRGLHHSCFPGTPGNPSNTSCAVPDFGNQCTLNRRKPSGELKANPKACWYWIHFRSNHFLVGVFLDWQAQDSWWTLEDDKWSCQVLIIWCPTTTLRQSWSHHETQ